MCIVDVCACTPSKGLRNCEPWEREQGPAWRDRTMRAISGMNVTPATNPFLNGVKNYSTEEIQAS